MTVDVSEYAVGCIWIIYNFSKTLKSVFFFTVSCLLLFLLSGKMSQKGPKLRYWEFMKNKNVYMQKRSGKIKVKRMVILTLLLFWLLFCCCFFFLEKTAARRRIRSPYPRDILMASSPTATAAIESRWPCRNTWQPFWEEGTDRELGTKDVDLPICSALDAPKLSCVNTSSR